jgi:uncharacterized protein (TIGR02594 family)
VADAIGLGSYARLKAEWKKPTKRATSATRKIAEKAAKGRAAAPAPAAEATPVEEEEDKDLLPQPAILREWMEALKKYGETALLEKVGKSSWAKLSPTLQKKINDVLRVRETESRETREAEKEKAKPVRVIGANEATILEALALSRATQRKQVDPSADAEVRWTYEDVVKWLYNKSQEIQGAEKYIAASANHALWFSRTWALSRLYALAKGNADARKALEDEAGRLFDAMASVGRLGKVTEDPANKGDFVRAVLNPAQYMASSPDNQQLATFIDNFTGTLPEALSHVVVSLRQDALGDRGRMAARNQRTGQALQDASDLGQWGQNAVKGDDFFADEDELGTRTPETRSEELDAVRTAFDDAVAALGGDVTTNLNGVLGRIAADKGNSYAGIAEILSKANAASFVQGVTIIDDPDKEPAFYDPDSKTITFNRAVASVRGFTDDIVHETLHAATDSFLSQAHPAGSPEAKIVEELLAIQTTLLARFKAAAPSWKAALGVAEGTPDFFSDLVALRAATLLESDKRAWLRENAVSAYEETMTGDTVSELFYDESLKDAATRRQGLIDVLRDFEYALGETSNFKAYNNGIFKEFLTLMYTSPVFQEAAQNARELNTPGEQAGPKFFTRFVKAVRNLLGTLVKSRTTAPVKVPDYSILRDLLAAQEESRSVASRRPGPTVAPVIAPPVISPPVIAPPRAPSITKPRRPTFGAAKPAPAATTTSTESEAYAEAMQKKAAREAAGGTTGEWKPPGPDEPPIPAGTVRFYHAGADPKSGGSRWVSPSRQWVSGFRPGAAVYFVDVPVNDPQLTKAYDDSGIPMSARFMNFEADEEKVKGFTLLAPTAEEQAAASPIRNVASLTVPTSYNTPAFASAFENAIDQATTATGFGRGLSQVTVEVEATELTQQAESEDEAVAALEPITKIEEAGNLASLPDDASVEEIFDAAPKTSSAAVSLASVYKDFGAWSSAVQRRLGAAVGRFAKTIWNGLKVVAALAIAGSMYMGPLSPETSAENLPTSTQLADELTQDELVAASVATSAVTQPNATPSTETRPTPELTEVERNASFKAGATAALNKFDAQKVHYVQFGDEFNKLALEATPLTPAMKELASLMGQKEGTRATGPNRLLAPIFRHGGVRGSQDEIPWCAMSVSYALTKAGTPTRNAFASEFLSEGTRVTTPQIGDVVVFNKRNEKDNSILPNTAGHVGFFMADLGNYILVLDGNVGDKVAITAMSKRRFMQYRRVTTPGTRAPFTITLSQGAANRLAAGFATADDTQEIVTGVEGLIEDEHAAFWGRKPEVLGTRRREDPRDAARTMGAPAASFDLSYDTLSESEKEAYDKAEKIGRNPWIAALARRMREGRISAGEYADAVDSVDPFVVKGAEDIPSDDRVRQYMAVSKPTPSPEKMAKIGAAIEDGVEYEFRIDIPTYNASAEAGDAVYAITAHEVVPEGATRVGTPLSYIGIARVQNPRFITRAISGKGDASMIAAGSGKTPLATVKGTYQAIDRVPDDINDANIWTEAGYNPIRSSYFVDVRSKKAVVGGSEAILVGSRTFVKDAVLEERNRGTVEEGRADDKTMRVLYTRRRDSAVRRLPQYLRDALPEDEAQDINDLYDVASGASRNSPFTLDDAIYAGRATRMALTWLLNEDLRRVISNGNPSEGAKAADLSHALSVLTESGGDVAGKAIADIYAMRTAPGMREASLKAFSPLGLSIKSRIASTPGFFTPRALRIDDKFHATTRALSDARNIFSTVSGPSSPDTLAWKLMTAKDPAKILSLVPESSRPALEAARATLRSNYAEISGKSLGTLTGMQELWDLASRLEVLKEAAVNPAATADSRGMMIPRLAAILKEAGLSPEEITTVRQGLVTYKDDASRFSNAVSEAARAAVNRFAMGAKVPAGARLEFMAAGSEALAFRDKAQGLVYKIKLPQRMGADTGFSFDVAPPTAAPEEGEVLFNLTDGLGRSPLWNELNEIHTAVPGIVDHEVVGFTDFGALITVQRDVRGQAYSPAEDEGVIEEWMDANGAKRIPAGRLYSEDFARDATSNAFTVTDAAGFTRILADVRPANASVVNGAFLLFDPAISPAVEGEAKEILGTRRREALQGMGQRLADWARLDVDDEIRQTTFIDPETGERVPFADVAASFTWGLGDEEALEYVQWLQDIPNMSEMARDIVSGIAWTANIRAATTPDQEVLGTRRRETQSLIPSLTTFFGMTQVPGEVASRTKLIEAALGITRISRWASEKGKWGSLYKVQKELENNVQRAVTLTETLFSTITSRMDKAGLNSKNMTADQKRQAADIDTILGTIDTLRDEQAAQAAEKERSRARRRVAMGIAQRRKLADQMTPANRMRESASIATDANLQYAQIETTYFDAIIAAEQASTAAFKQKQADAAARLKADGLTNVLEAAQNLRNHLNDLSLKIQATTGADARVRAHYNARMGIHLSQYYEIHDNPAYAAWLWGSDPEAVKLRTAGLTWIRNARATRFAADLKSRMRGATTQEIERVAKEMASKLDDSGLMQELNDVIQKHMNRGGVGGVGSPGMLNGTILMERMNVPKELRELLGEYRDHVATAARTALEMGIYYANYVYLDGIRTELQSRQRERNKQFEDLTNKGPLRTDAENKELERLRGTYFITDDAKLAAEYGLKAFKPKTSMINKAAFGSLQGFYGPEITVEAMNDLEGGGGTNAVLNGYAELLGVTMKSFTVWNVRGQARNFLSSIAFIPASGHLSIPVWRESALEGNDKASAFFKHWGALGNSRLKDRMAAIGVEKAVAEFTDMYVRRGIIGGSDAAVFREEMRKISGKDYGAAVGRVLNKYNQSASTVTTKASDAAEVFKAIDRFMTEVHRGSDDYFKKILFELEYAARLKEFGVEVKDGVPVMTDKAATRIIQVYGNRGLLTPANEAEVGGDVKARAQLLMEIVSAEATFSKIPYYNRLPEVVNAFKRQKLGLGAAPFISWPAAMWSQPFKAYQQYKQDRAVPETADRAWKTAVAYGATAAGWNLFVGTTLGAIVWALSHLGMGDEDKKIRPVFGIFTPESRALQDFLNKDFYKYRSIAILGMRGENPVWADVSWMNPWSAVTDVLTPFFHPRARESSTDFIDAAKASLDKVLKTVLSPQIPISNAFDALSADDFRTKNASFGEKLIKVAGAVLEPLVPMTVKDAFKVGNAVGTERGFTEFVSTISGLKINETDIRESLARTARGVAAQDAETMDRYRRLLTNGRADDIGKLETLYDEGMEDMRRLYLDLYQKMGSGAVFLGSDTEVRKIVREDGRGLGFERLQDLNNGVIRGWKPGPTTLERAARMATKEGGDDRVRKATELPVKYGVQSLSQ